MTDPASQQSLIDRLYRLAPYMIPFAFMMQCLSHGPAYALHPDKGGLLAGPVIYFLVLLIDRFKWKEDVKRQLASKKPRFYVHLFLASTGTLSSLSILLMLAIDQGLLDRSWYFSIGRTSGLLFGLCLIMMGNYFPKIPSPWRHREEPFDWQGVHHFVGIVFLVAGVLIFFAWAILPVPDAKQFATAVLLTMAVIVVARKWYSLLTWKGRSLS